jgi:hypothetical protein
LKSDNMLLLIEKVQNRIRIWQSLIVSSCDSWILATCLHQYYHLLLNHDHPMVLCCTRRPAFFCFSLETVSASCYVSVEH